MKKLTFVFLCVLTSISFTSFASNNATDTLKKTSEYALISKTANINDVFISKNKKAKEEVVKIKISFATLQANSNAIKTAVLQGNKQYGEDNHPTISNVKILNGKYEDMKGEAASKTASIYTFSQLKFPLHLQVTTMGEIVDFELLEPGKWDINLNLKK